MSGSCSPNASKVLVGNTDITSTCKAKCLGVVWTPELSPKASIENNINKARRAFFAIGSHGIYHGKQNPLTSSEIYNACILPVCLYGCENWLLTDPLLTVLSKLKWAREFYMYLDIMPISAL